MGNTFACTFVFRVLYYHQRVYFELCCGTVSVSDGDVCVCWVNLSPVVYAISLCMCVKDALVHCMVEQFNNYTMPLAVYIIVFFPSVSCQRQVVLQTLSHDWYIFVLV